MSKTYEAALTKANKASREFMAAQSAYRNRQIGDAEFLAAKALNDAASKEFDAAFSLENQWT